MQELSPGQAVIVPIDEMYVESLGCVEAFRRLGFPADDVRVFVGPNRSRAGRWLYVSLMTQGTEFTVAVSQVPDSMDDQAIIEGWQTTVELVQHLSSLQIDALWKRSSMSDVPTFQALAMQMHLRGISLPNNSVTDMQA